MQAQAQTQIQIQELVNDIISNPEKYPMEAKYLLRLQRWIRQGSAFDDKAVFEVAFGEVDVIVLKEWDEGYPYRKGEDVVLIPRTVPVVVVWKNYWDYGTERGTKQSIYVFTGSEWKRIDI
jgi:hypothetical protein